MQIVSIYLHIKAWLTVFYFWCRLLPSPKLNKLVCLAFAFFFFFLETFLELLCISEAPICGAGGGGKVSGRICGAGWGSNPKHRRIYDISLRSAEQILAYIILFIKLISFDMKTYAVLGGEAVQKIYLTPPLFFAKFRRRGGSNRVLSTDWK